MQTNTVLEISSVVTEKKSKRTKRKAGCRYPTNKVSEELSLIFFPSCVIDFHVPQESHSAFLDLYFPNENIDSDITYKKLWSLKPFTFLNYFVFVRWKHP